MSLPPATSAPVPALPATVARAACPRGHRYLATRATLGTRFAGQDFGDLFSSRGQPGDPPWRLARVTVLPFAEGLSDRQAAAAGRARLDRRYARGLELPDPGFAFSLLGEFRARSRAGKAADRLLTALLPALQDRGRLKARGQQRTDSPHVVAAMRTHNRLECIGETMRAALTAVAAAAPTWLREHPDPRWAERYPDRVQAYRLPTGQAARGRHAAAIGADGYTLRTAVAAPAAPPARRALPAGDPLRRVVRWRDNAARPPAAVRIQSPHAAAAQFGSKREPTWTGHKGHRTASCDPGRPARITNGETTAATPPAFRAQHARRAGSEGTRAQCARARGRRRARYRGLARTHQQHLCIATARHVLRAGDRLVPPPARQPPRSPCSALRAG
jgi:transposase